MLSQCVPAFKKLLSRLIISITCFVNISSSVKSIITTDIVSLRRKHRYGDHYKDIPIGYITNICKLSIKWIGKSDNIQEYMTQTQLFHLKLNGKY